MNRYLALFALLLLPQFGFAAEQPLTLLTMQPGEDGAETYSTSIQILLIMTLLSLLPAILMTMTSFTRIIVVLAILRQAMGTMQTPSNQILLGLALFTSFFIMSPAKALVAIPSESAIPRIVFFIVVLQKLSVSSLKRELQRELRRK